MTARPRLTINLRDSRPLWSIPDWAIAEISDAAPDHLDVVVVSAPADGRGDGGAASPEALEAIAGAEIHLGFGFPRRLCDAARQSGDNLRWVHSGAAGVGGAIHPGMAESSIVLTNSAGIHAEPMADTVMAMILYFARGLDHAVAAQRAGRWHRDPFDSPSTSIHELAGTTLGIAGFGGIGEAVARRALALGMRVLGYRRRPIPTALDVHLLTGEKDLDRLLDESRYLVLSLPNTPATTGLLDRRRLDRLRTDAVVINVGRGDVLDEDALAMALGEGRIRGAGLDVFAREPLPSDSPLWSLPNVLITPHVSATTDRFWRREVDLIVRNLHRYARGEPLLNLVDPEAGY